MELRLSEAGKNYWNGKGAYQEEYHKLYDELVPKSGSSETLKGELIRAVSRLVYEHCNNGNCNARQSDYHYHIHSWDGEEEEEEEEGEVYVSEFYDKFLTLIMRTVKGTMDLVYNVEKLICEDPDDFSESAMSLYAHLCDHVIHYVLDPETPDRPLKEVDGYKID